MCVCVDDFDTWCGGVPCSVYIVFFKCSMEPVETFKLLLEHGADPNAEYTNNNRYD